VNGEQDEIKAFYPIPYGVYKEISISNSLHRLNSNLLGQNNSIAATSVTPANAIDTHINLGWASTTGQAGQEFEYCTVTGGNNNTAGNTGATVCGGTNNAVNDSLGTITGGSNNNMFGTAAFIGGGDTNIIRADKAVVCGGGNNAAAGTFSVIGGGNSNTSGASSSVISGGMFNTIFGPDGSSGTIAGGANNTITSDGNCGTIAGGNNNMVNSKESTIGGGTGNNTQGWQATVAGGISNSAHYRSFVGGGDTNVASGQWSIIGGGQNNQAAQAYATITGGSSNIASGQATFIGGGYNNLAEGSNSTICGGANNSAAGNGSTICGGDHNITNGQNAFIAGGENNTAGDYSFAGGNRAKASNPGCFVWADSQNSDYFPNRPNAFSIRAQNGAFLQTGGSKIWSDVAEFMDVLKKDSVKGGEIVSITGKDRLTKSKISYDNSLIGVVSSDRTFRLNLGDEQSPYEDCIRLPVTLVGRVFVNICDENGPIHIGDPITSSSNPGIGMKATRAGKIIGYAMEEFSKDKGEILVFVNLCYYVPPEEFFDLKERIEKLEVVVDREALYE
jgi:hypothetical protein